MTVVTETVSLSVNEATREFGKGLTKLVADAKEALKSGSTVVQVLELAKAALEDLLPVLNDIAKLPEEAASDVPAELDMVFLFARDLYHAIKA